MEYTPSLGIQRVASGKPYVIRRANSCKQLMIMQNYKSHEEGWQTLERKWAAKERWNVKIQVTQGSPNSFPVTWPMHLVYNRCRISNSECFSVRWLRKVWNRSCSKVLLVMIALQLYIRKCSNRNKPFYQFIYRPTFLFVHRKLLTVFADQILILELRRKRREGLLRFKSDARQPKVQQLKRNTYIHKDSVC